MPEFSKHCSVFDHMKISGKFFQYWKEVSIGGIVIVATLFATVSIISQRSVTNLSSNQIKIDIATLDSGLDYKTSISLPAFKQTSSEDGVGGNANQNQNPTSQQQSSVVVNNSETPQPETAQSNPEQIIEDQPVRVSAEPGNQDGETNTSQPPFPVLEEPSEEQNDNAEEAIPEPIIEEPIPILSDFTAYWVYPGDPACNTFNELQQFENIDQLKPEFATITDEGLVNILTTEIAGCNALSDQNVEFYKSISDTQFITVSSSGIGLSNLLATRESRQAGIDELMSLLDQTQMTGIELDFEGFGKWTVEDYIGYLDFVTVLGNTLHSQGKELMIDAPAIYNQRIQDAFKFKYADLDNLPIDYITIMAYDYQYDFGGGAPITEDDFLRDSISWAKQEISNHERLIIGLPSYGYGATRGEYSDIQIYTFDQLVERFGQDRLSQAERMPNSQELVFDDGGMVYVFQDAASISHKTKLVNELGINRISIWHLGGNPIVK